MILRTDTLHVVPRDDLIEHEDTDTCICGPAIEPVVTAVGSYSWIVVHHALDGRETG